MANETESRSKRTAPGKIGTVASRSGAKSIRVVVDHLVPHKMYGKYVRRRTKVGVHDPNDDAKVGDRVEIVPCRRISRTKAWRLVRIVRRSVQTVPPAQAVEQPAEAGQQEG